MERIEYHFKYSRLSTVYDDPIMHIIGNHAEILSQETVTLKTGPATLLLVEYTLSAAEEAKLGKQMNTYEYWLVQNQFRPYPGRSDMELSMCCKLNSRSSSSVARSKVLTLAKGWYTPGN